MPNGNATLTCKKLAGIPVVAKFATVRQEDDRLVEQTHPSLFISAGQFSTTTIRMFKPFCICVVICKKLSARSDCIGLRVEMREPPGIRTVGRLGGFVIHIYITHWIKTCDKNKSSHIPSKYWIGSRFESEGGT